MDPSLSRTIFKLLEGAGAEVIGVPGKADIELNGLSIQDPHGKIMSEGGSYKIEPSSRNAKILVNGRQITESTLLVHLDRIVFGSTQYYLFVDPTKATAKDPVHSFETAQEEIGKYSGVIPSDGAKLSQEQMILQAELMELLPEIEEANSFSIVLGKFLTSFINT